MSWILLIRHVESYKNIRDEHGGKGDKLTIYGHNQIERILTSIKFIQNTFLLENKCKFNGIWCSEIIQINETATLLGNFLSLQKHFDDRIRSLNLGLLSGLSKKDALKRHPKVANDLEKWRQDKLEIIDLIIPEAEIFQDFYQRGQDFINYISNTKLNPIIIGSRSILILLLNILLSRDPYKKKQYHPWIFHQPSMCLFKSNNNWNLLYTEGVYNCEYEALQVN